MSALWRWSVAVVCLMEFLSIVGTEFGVSFLRRLPTVSHLAGRSLVFAVAVLVVLALHFAASRPLPGG